MTNPEAEVRALFRGHSGAVYRYLAGVYGRPRDAEEVTQAVFLQLHLALQRGERPASPRAWLLVAGRQLMLERLRRSAAAAAVLPPLAGLSELERECLCARSQGLTLHEIGCVVGLDYRHAARVLISAAQRFYKSLPRG